MAQATKKILFICLSISLVLSTAKMLCLTGAGVLPFVKKNDTIYFLISQERWGKYTDLWDDFGGGQNHGEHIRETAIREAYEESMGYFGNQDFWSKKVRSAYNNGQYVNDYGYYSYVADLSNNKHIKEKSLTQIISDLKTTLKHYQLIGKSSYTEKKDFQWVTPEMLLQMSYDGTYRQKPWKVTKLIEHALLICFAT